MSEIKTLNGFELCDNYARTQLNAKVDSSALTNHTTDTTNPHSVTAAQVGALPTTGGTMTGILYTSASTPLLIGTNGKVGMRAKTNDVNNVGQINVSNAWWSTGNQWGAQISGYNGETGGYNQLRVSHEGVQYIGEDDVAHQVLHDGNVGTYAATRNEFDNHKHTVSDITDFNDVTSNIQSQLDVLQETINNMTSSAPILTDDGQGNVILSSDTLDNALDSIENGSY